MLEATTQVGQIPVALKLVSVKPVSAICGADQQDCFFLKLITTALRNPFSYAAGRISQIALDNMHVQSRGVEYHWVVAFS